MAGAEKILLELVDRQEAQVLRLAENHFNLGEIQRLKFQPVLALPHFRRASQLALDNPVYAFWLGRILQDQKEFVESEAAYTQALKIRRSQAQANPSSFGDDLALVASNLAFHLGKNGRPEQKCPLLAEAAAAAQSSHWVELIAFARQACKDRGHGNESRLTRFTACVGCDSLSLRDSEMLDAPDSLGPWREITPSGTA